ncbi:hypothetical protein GCM10007205_10640 [Oxalicibacterium flavum]|uniref:DUF4434 domain-containing protein n=2 Tax=Oxalicibacterium flavum TaxID=179467 RepID=A0A8J2UN77_9BURK|nr:hypothetical protein GCM10007205_10640 [Oxalicibacterium flavum]
MDMLFDLAGERSIGLHLGLPYHQNWWAILKAKDFAELDTFFAQTLNSATRYIEESPLSSHANFRGWYIPYELEQYHWGTASSQEKLIPWLQSLSNIATTDKGLQPAISTYFSQLPTDGSLVSLWSNILDHANLYPMIQDGVGVAGLGNYEALVPLQQLFNTRQIRYDLIVELFHQLSDDTKQEKFLATSASPSRVRKQMEVASSFGATRIVAFAIDPWLTDDTAPAQRLRQALIKN